MASARTYPTPRAVIAVIAAGVIEAAYRRLLGKPPPNREVRCHWYCLATALGLRARGLTQAAWTCRRVRSLPYSGLAPFAAVALTSPDVSDFGPHCSAVALVAIVPVRVTRTLEH